MNLTSPAARTGGTRDDDRGFTLIELLIVIVILGVLATVVVLSVTGIRDDADDSGCLAERRTVLSGVEAYFVVTGSDTINEQSIVDAGLLRNTSELYDVQVDGTVVPAVPGPCPA